MVSVVVVVAVLAGNREVGDTGMCKGVRGRGRGGARGGGCGVLTDLRKSRNVVCCALRNRN